MSTIFDNLIQLLDILINGVGDVPDFVAHICVSLPVEIQTVMILTVLLFLVAAIVSMIRH